MVSLRKSLFPLFLLCLVCLFTTNAQVSSQTGGITSTSKSTPSSTVGSTNSVGTSQSASSTVKIQNPNPAATPKNANTAGNNQNANPTTSTQNANQAVTAKTVNPKSTNGNGSPASTKGTTDAKPLKPSNGKQTTKSEPDSPLSALSPWLLRIIQQVGTTIPGFEYLMKYAGFGFSQSQLETVNDFINLLMNVTNTRPSNLTDVWDALQSSNVFNSKTIPKDTFEMCKMLNQSTEDGNTTLAEFLELKEPLWPEVAWMNVSLDDVLSWCSNNFTNTTIDTQRKFPWMDIPKSHSVYYWKKCQNDISVMLQSLTQADSSWALQMLDASGKPSSSILKGNLKFMGNYKECQDVSHRDRTTLSTIEGNVCRASIKSPVPLPGSFLAPGQEVRIQWDLCLPKSCLDTDLNLAIVENNIAPNVWMYCTKDLDMSDDGPAIFAVALLSLFGLLLVAGTIMEFCISRTPPKQRYYSNGHVTNGGANINQGFDHDEKNHVTSFTEPNGKPPMVERNVDKEEILYPHLHHRNGIQDTTGHNGVVKEDKESTHKPQPAPLRRWEKALLAFSVPRNTEKILSVKSAAGTIGCLHGIRVLSMAWVILGHTLISMQIYENPVDLFGLIKTMGFQLIMNAPLSVDTFFVMSGCLTCYLFMKTLGKKGKVTPKDLALYYVHRYWRLTPSLLIWIMVVACLLQYVGEGRPAWSDYLAADYCRKHWWVNMLYINNVYKQSEPCVGVTWFLAHDMQFYVVAPLVLVPWVYGKKILGFFVAICYIGIHVSSTIWLEIKYNADLLRNQADYSPEIYFKPYTRVAPFAIGLMLGWALWKTKCKAKMNKCLVFLGWIVCLGLILTLTLVTYDENKDIPKSDWTKTGRVVFETFYRPTWALAISWLIFACASGYGGYINSILSWEGWLPLSRLTYSAYLIHLTILGFETYVPEYTMLFTLTSLSYYFLGTFVMAYAVGYILTITVESPMLALEKVVLG